MGLYQKSSGVRKRPFRILGISMVVVGALLLISSAAYFVYARFSEAQLERLVQKAGSETPGGYTSETWEKWSLKEAEEADLLSVAYEEPEESAGAPQDNPVEEADTRPAEETPQPAEPLPPLGPPMPGVRLPLGATLEPLYLPDISLQESALDLPVVRVGEGKTAPKLSSRSLPTVIKSFLPAERIVIPSINVDSRVVHLDVIWEKGVLVWETAKNAVGHHNGTPNPGERGNVVMSGHKSSPIKGEGAVFHDLYRVKPGDEVWLYTDEYRFLYRVVGIKITLPEDVDVFASTPDPTLTLITCEPDLVYSHRLIVTAKLVGASPLGETQQQ